MTLTAYHTARESRWPSSQLVPFIIIILVSLALLIPVASSPPLLHDSFPIDWVWADQFTSLLAHGNLLPRWLPLSNSGLGSPVFYYYPPGAFYLTGLFGLAGLSTYSSIMAAFGTASAASGVFTFAWLKHRSHRPLLGALFFVAAPYAWFDFTRRGALAESVAIIFVPLIAIGLRRVAERKSPLLLTISYAGMIFTHLPLALLTSVFLILPYVLVHRRETLKFAEGGTLGILLSSSTLLPALALDKWREAGWLWLNPVFKPAYWSVFAHHWEVGFVLQVHLMLLTIGLAGLMLFLVRRDRWGLLAAIVCVVMAGLLPLFWSLPLMAKVQFPYRALPIAEFALATALARVSGPDKNWLYVAGPALVLTSIFARPPLPSSVTTIEELARDHPDELEYLPKGTVALDPQILSLKTAAIVKGRLPSPTVPRRIVEPHFYFPSWSCGEIEPRSKLLMHDEKCRPHIIWTGVEKLGASLTGLAMLILFGLTLWRARSRTPVRPRQRI